MQKVFWSIFSNFVALVGGPLVPLCACVLTCFSPFQGKKVWVDFSQPAPVSSTAWKKHFDGQKNYFLASLHCLLCRKGWQKCIPLLSLPLRTGSLPLHLLCLCIFPTRSLACAYYGFLECSTFSRNDGLQFTQPLWKTLTGLTSVRECASYAEKRSDQSAKKINTFMRQVRSGIRKQKQKLQIKLFLKCCVRRILRIKTGFTQKHCDESLVFMLMFGMCFLPPSSFTFRMALGNGTALMLKPDRKLKRTLLLHWHRNCLYDMVRARNPNKITRVGGWNPWEERFNTVLILLNCTNRNSSTLNIH